MSNERYMYCSVYSYINSCAVSAWSQIDVIKVYQTKCPLTQLIAEVGKTPLSLNWHPI